MRNLLYRFFAPPVFPEDEDRTRTAFLLNIIGWSLLFVVAIILILRSIQRQDANLQEVNLVLTVIILAIALILFLNHKGFVRLASILLVSIVWIGLCYTAWVADGIRDVTFFGFAVPILMAGLLIGWQGAIFFTVASILSGWLLAYAETYQLFFPTLDTPMHFARDLSGIFALMGILIYLTISNLQKALKKSRAAAQELSLSNQELNELRIELEQRVDERTS
jgi:hypothetical protein